MKVNQKEILQAIVREIVVNDKLLKQEKINEFSKGVRPNGNIIGKYRDPEYAIFKQSINPLAGGNVDLILKRGFTNSLRVEKLYPKAFLFNSTDSKRDKLIAQYGTDIMGINQEYWEKRQKEVYLPTFRFQVKRLINIGYR